MPKKSKRGRGRPEARIDPTQLLQLCIMQATDEEIAAFFKVSTKTIQRRRESATVLTASEGKPSDEDASQFRGTFAEVMERGRARGRLSIRRRLFEIMGNPIHQGCVAAAIFLAKNLLGYRDHPLPPAAPGAAADPQPGALQPGATPAERQAAILGAVSSGIPLQLACSMYGVAKKQFVAWLEDDPAFEEAVRAAAAGAEGRLLQVIAQAAQRGDFGAAVWVLERHPKYRERWAKPGPTTAGTTTKSTTLPANTSENSPPSPPQISWRKKALPPAK